MLITLLDSSIVVNDTQLMKADPAIVVTLLGNIIFANAIQL